MNLKDVFDKDIFSMDGECYTDADLQSMPLDDLETLKMRITKKISIISEAIKEKQTEYFNNGTDAKEWLIKRKRERSIKQRILTYINYLIKKQIRESRSVNDYFVDHAKIVLPKAEFESILATAHKEMKTLGGN